MGGPPKQYLRVGGYRQDVKGQGWQEQWRTPDPGNSQWRRATSTREAMVRYRGDIGIMEKKMETTTMRLYRD